MKLLFCLAIGYLLGMFSPAALFSRKKQVDLRQAGTGNLGATNAMLVMGKTIGVVVMVLDVLKAFFACKLAQLLFPRLATAGVLAGLGAMLGHIYPCYLGFKGGKGLAAFGGMILAHNHWIFLFMLVTAVILALIVNYTVAVHIYAAFAFPFLVGMQTHSVAITLVCALAGLLLLAKNWYIIARIRRGEDVKVRQFLKGE